MGKERSKYIHFIERRKTITAVWKSQRLVSQAAGNLKEIDYYSYCVSGGLRYFGVCP